MKYITFILFLATALCRGQGTLIVRFEEPPAVSGGSYRLARNYYEAGMWFRQDTNYYINMQLTRQGANEPIPDNGTTYLVPSGGILLDFSLTNGSPFSLASVDLSRSNSSDPDPSIGSLVGYRPDGSTISTNFSVAGLTFQTFHLGPEFSGLVRVEIPGTPAAYWALDNLVFSVVPEPSSLVLFGLGGLCLATNVLRKRRREK